MLFSVIVVAESAPQAVAHRIRRRGCRKHPSWKRLLCHRGETPVPPWWNRSAIVVEPESHRGGTDGSL